MEIRALNKAVQKKSSIRLAKIKKMTPIQWGRVYLRGQLFHRVIQGQVSKCKLLPPSDPAITLLDSILYNENVFLLLFIHI